MYFFGAIKHSQVAINCGEVTQTMVKDVTTRYPDGPARVRSEPDSGSVPGKSATSPEPMQQPQPAAPAWEAGQISFEAFCRRYLQPMLCDLQRRIPELGLDRDTQKDLEQTITELLADLESGPVAMATVKARLDHVYQVLEMPRQDLEGFPDGGLRGLVRGGAS